jgi:hypothetical protein
VSVFIIFNAICSEEFLVSKVIKNDEDDMGDVLEEATDVDNVNVIIDNTDYSYMPEEGLRKRGEGAEYEMTTTESDP